MLHLFTPRHQGQSTGERLFTIIVKPSIKSPTSHTPTPPLVMPTEPGAHEGGLNLSPGRPGTWFSGYVSAVCVSAIRPCWRHPLAPLEWRRERGHDTPKRSGGGGDGQKNSGGMIARTTGFGCRNAEPIKMQTELALRVGLPLELALQTLNVRRTCSLRGCKLLQMRGKRANGRTFLELEAQ